MNLPSFLCRNCWCYMCSVLSLVQPIYYLFSKLIIHVHFLTTTVAYLFLNLALNWMRFEFFFFEFTYATELCYHLSIIVNYFSFRCFAMIQELKDVSKHIWWSSYLGIRVKISETWRDLLQFQSDPLVSGFIVDTHKNSFVSIVNSSVN